MTLPTTRFSILAPALLALITLGCQPTVTPVPERPAPTTDTAADAHAGHEQMEHDAHAGHQMGGLPAVTIPEGALYTEADVRFMQMMIAHHAQAVHMTRLAEGAGASDRVLRLARKIDLSQAGEIALMQGWLGDHGQFVPDAEDSWRGMTMAGMLSDSELAQLSAARGVDFDRLFLRLMIKHHEGAIQMVTELLNSPRAAQDVDVNVLANEVEATQTAEIGLMFQMLGELG